MAQSRRILVIDDERRMADSICQLLEREGCEPVAAYTGRDGLRLLDEQPFDLVITDLRMSEVDGLDVLRHIRENGLDTLAIVITGHASTESAIEAMHHEAFDYLPKPFEFDRLLMSVTRAFHRREAEQLRADMISMISHDIKVPLTSIIGYTSLMHDRRTGQWHAQAQDFLNIISSNANKILTLLDNYLTTCKHEAGRLIIQRSPVRLSDLFAEMESILVPEAAKRNIQFCVACPRDLPELQADENLLLRALCNLASNALKYTPPNSEVRVEAAHVPADQSPLEHDSIRCTVENPGPGIAPEDLSHLFERYLRTKSSRGIEGTGLGLFVVKTITEAHGGTVSAESEPGHLTRFTLWLPLVPAALTA